MEHISALQYLSRDQLESLVHRLQAEVSLLGGQLASSEARNQLLQLSLPQMIRECITSSVNSITVTCKRESVTDEPQQHKNSDPIHPTNGIAKLNYTLPEAPFLEQEHSCSELFVPPTNDPVCSSNHYEAPPFSVPMEPYSPTSSGICQLGSFNRLHGSLTTDQNRASHWRLIPNPVSETMDPAAKKSRLSSSNRQRRTKNANQSREEYRKELIESLAKGSDNENNEALGIVASSISSSTTSQEVSSAMSAVQGIEVISSMKTDNSPSIPDGAPFQPEIIDSVDLISDEEDAPVTSIDWDQMSRVRNEIMKDPSIISSRSWLAYEATSEWSRATCSLMNVLFDEDQLNTCTVLGRSSKSKQRNPLPADRVNFIVGSVNQRFGTSCTKIRARMAQKLKDSRRKTRYNDGTSVILQSLDHTASVRQEATFAQVSTVACLTTMASCVAGKDPTVKTIDRPRRARIGLNGFGKLARTLLRCSLEDQRGLDIVAINEPNLTPEQMLYLIKFDTNLGPFKGYVNDKVHVNNGKENGTGEYCNLEVAGRMIGVFHSKEVDEIPWNWLEVEYILETTGKLRQLKEATKHLLGGRARKVLVVGDVLDIPLLMYPISCRGYQRGTSVVASGSPMAHAVSTLVSLVEESCGMEECMVTLLLPVDERQNLVDAPTTDLRSWRKGRGAIQSIIPGRCPTLVQSVIQAIPNLRNRFDAITMHVPTFEGAMVDLTFRTLEPLNGTSEIIDKIIKNSLLERYNDLHVKTQPTHQRSNVCDNLPQLPFAAPSSSTLEAGRTDSELSASNLSSGPGLIPGDEVIPVIRMPSNLTSMLVPLHKEDAYVSSDCTGKHTMSLLSVDCCLSLPYGNSVKLVSWFDLNTSFCERILDTIVFMRGVDHH